FQMYFFLLNHHTPISTLFPYTTLFRSNGERTVRAADHADVAVQGRILAQIGLNRSGRQRYAVGRGGQRRSAERRAGVADVQRIEDRKSTRLNSSHLVISYAVFCLKKKK